LRSSVFLFAKKEKKYIRKYNDEREREREREREKEELLLDCYRARGSSDYILV